MKYQPDYPNRFESIAAARLWARRFFDCYNLEHYQSSLNFLTPASVYYGDAPFVQRQRQLVMDAAYTAHPERLDAALRSSKALLWRLHQSAQTHTESALISLPKLFQNP